MYSKLSGTVLHLLLQSTPVTNLFNMFTKIMCRELLSIILQFLFFVLIFIREELTKYMESKGAASPGVLVLTTMLSKPFRRLDKYSGMLQELERHVEEYHPDRGDTQRSVSVYKDIAVSTITLNSIFYCLYWSFFL